MGTAMKEQSKYDQLMKDGYCIFENILDAPMLQKVREASGILIAKQTQAEKELQRSTGSLISVTNHPFFAELVALPEALAALDSLGYPNSRFSSGYVISKPAKSPRLFWHYDYAAWDDPDAFGEVPQQLFLMYYLIDTTVENGCLRVIPGSHIHDNPLHLELQEAHSDKLSKAQDLDMPEFSVRPDEVNIMVKAGDLLIGDSRLLHASHANESNDRRTVITLWFHPMESLSEQVQAFIARMTPQQAPADWPQQAKELLETVLARYQGDQEPITWNRNRPNRG